MARKRHLLFNSLYIPIKIYRKLIKHSRSLRLFGISLFAVGWIAIGFPGLATEFSSTSSQISSTHPQELVDRSKALYESGQWTQALPLLQQAIQTYQSQGDKLGAAIALRNLALVYQQLGAWAEARAAITQSWELLNSDPHPPTEALAQTLEIRGQLEFTTGEIETALTTWEQASEFYTQIHDPPGVARSTIHQAEALQTLGLYQRATDRLEQLLSQLQTQPDTIFTSAALRNLGDALRLSGKFDQANTALQHSLTIAQRLSSAEAQTATLLSLGNLDYAQGNYLDSRTKYQKALDRSTTLLSQIQAQLNLADAAFRDGLIKQTRSLIHEIATELDQLPLNRASLYANLNFTQQWLGLTSRDAEPGLPTLETVLPIAQKLATIRQQAIQLGDRKAESFALGQLGGLYEQVQQWQEAQQLTEEALNLAQQINANEVSYRWSWQLGRILTAEGKQTDAITAYTNAVSTLQLLRSDLVGISADLQVSFRKSVEPIHRELVGLLLQYQEKQAPTPTRLEQARQTIESLQLAELENFFREACLNAQPVQLDQLDTQAAVLYPILLPDRLEIILSLPQQPLLHRTTPIAQMEVVATVRQLFQALQKPPNQVSQHLSNQAKDPIETNLRLEAKIYNWLIRPLREDLDRSSIKTIVFVLDDALREIPMSVLYDGQHYLIENYSIALAPGLQLLPAGNRQRQQLDVLMLGLTEERQGFTELPNVQKEFDNIRAAIGNQGKVLLNQDFTRTKLEDTLNANPVPIVHLATHAQSSGNLEDTFILAWDGEIQINQLSALLQTATLSRRQPIELLVLSACQTAVGDDRAALGLAGIAVRAGARSTMATLWSVSDEAMAQLMGQLYEKLAQTDFTKAEALQQAQLSLLQNPSYKHPFYWSSVILLGNWA